MLTIRPARDSDCTHILALIRELAEFEQLAHTVQATEPQLREHLFGPHPRAEALIAEWAGQLAGFALYFHNFSTFLAQPGLYVEDIYVRPEFRRRGIGLSLFQYLAAIAVQRDCGRMEWSVLNWNTPAIEFYRSLGATPMDEWTVQRLTGEVLQHLAKGTSGQTEASLKSLLAGAASETLTPDDSQCGSGQVQRIVRRNPLAPE